MWDFDLKLNFSFSFFNIFFFSHHTYIIYCKTKQDIFLKNFAFEEDCVVCRWSISKIHSLKSHKFSSFSLHSAFSFFFIFFSVYRKGQCGCRAIVYGQSKINWPILISFKLVLFFYFAFICCSLFSLLSSILLSPTSKRTTENDAKNLEKVVTFHYYSNANWIEVMLKKVHREKKKKKKAEQEEVSNDFVALVDICTLNFLWWRSIDIILIKL